MILSLALTARVDRENCSLRRAGSGGDRLVLVHPPPSRPARPPRLASPCRQSSEEAEFLLDPGESGLSMEPRRDGPGRPFDQYHSDRVRSGPVGFLTRLVEHHKQIAF